MSSLNQRPDRTEAAEYYFTYIDKVPLGDVLVSLAAQVDEVNRRLGGVAEERTLARYAPGKWSVREVMNHINDTERLFVFRAFWFARGFDSPLPSFDQNAAILAAEGDRIPMAASLAEFRDLRASTIALFAALPAEAWDRRGVASDKPFSVRALAYLAAGHVAHHLEILDARYGI